MLDSIVYSSILLEANTLDLTAQKKNAFQVH